MPKTIMIVDDEPDNITTISTILKTNGYKVVTAVNGDDCLKKLKRLHPDLILMDVMMPGTPVNVVVKEIPDIKIAYLTVVRNPDAKKAHLEGAPNIVDYIQKPFDLNNFLKRVKKIVGD